MGTPKSSISIWCSLPNHDFWVSPIYGTLHIIFIHIHISTSMNTLKPSASLESRTAGLLFFTLFQSAAFHMFPPGGVPPPLSLFKVFKRARVVWLWAAQQSKSWNELFPKGDWEPGTPSPQRCLSSERSERTLPVPSGNLCHNMFKPSVWGNGQILGGTLWQFNIAIQDLITHTHIYIYIHSSIKYTHNYIKYIYIYMWLSNYQRPPPNFNQCHIFTGDGNSNSGGVSWLQRTAATPKFSAFERDTVERLDGWNASNFPKETDQDAVSIPGRQCCRGSLSCSFFLW